MCDWIFLHVNNNNNIQIYEIIEKIYEIFDCYKEKEKVSKKLNNLILHEKEILIDSREKCPFCFEDILL